MNCTNYYTTQLTAHFLTFETQADLARHLGVNAGLVSRVLSGKPSPTVYKAMVAHGMCEPFNAPRYRRCGEFESAESAAAYDAMLKEFGITTSEVLSDWLSERKHELRVSMGDDW